MKSKHEKITFYFIATAVIVCVIIFFVTFIRADLYSPGDTGMPAFIPETTIVPVSNPVTPSVSTTSMSTSTTTLASTSVSIESSAVDAAPAVPSMNPLRLIIPALGINAHVQYVGVNAKGNIGTPSNFTDVAWYYRGVIPGQTGVAIIDGHVDNGLGLAGIFKHLGDIHVGDEVDVVTKAGVTIAFVVASVQIYNYQDVSQEALFGDGSASSSLKLITCDGAWMSSSHTYDERLIVTAERVE